MSNSSDYIFLPSFSLQPNKLVSFNSVFIKNREDKTIKSIHDFKTKRIKTNGETKKTASIVRTTHNFQISDNAYRNLKKKINWLYYLAKSKKVTTYSGKTIYNFKVGFITLTLPSVQRTCTKEVTTNLLNNFLTEIRQRTNMTNYVWRLEFQKNGNVHYHIVTDTYLDYFLVQKIWNRILKLNGYIESYQQKFKNLSLSEYNNLTNKEGKTAYKTIVKRYAKGKRENWENPPTVDTRSVLSKSAIANYISKYFAKDSTDNPIQNKLDNQDNSNNLRLWFCSRSLSKLNTVSNFCDAVKYDLFALVSHAKKVKKVITKYAICYFFEIHTLSGNPRKWIEMLLKKYAFEKGYIPSG